MKENHSKETGLTSLASQLIDIQTVAILGHIRPDGDCIGSCMAAYNYIDTFYPMIAADVYLEAIPSIFQFLKNTDRISDNFQNDKEYDLCIVLDCGSLDRIGDAVKIFLAAKKTICIDHHISNHSFAEINHIKPQISSTSELIFELIDPGQITKEIAECIYVGMVHDTGVFQYSSTTARTMNIAGQLMTMGIDFTEIIDRTFYRKTHKQNKILGKVLLESRLYLEGRCIAGIVDAKAMEELALLPKHLDGIVNQLRVTRGVEAAIFMYAAEANSFKVSMRSNGSVDVAAIAAKFGGGGHVKAAGATIMDEPENIIHRICEEVQNQLNGAAK